MLSVSGQPVTWFDLNKFVGCILRTQILILDVIFKFLFISTFVSTGTEESYYFQCSSIVFGTNTGGLFQISFHARLAG